MFRQTKIKMVKMRGGVGIQMQMMTSGTFLAPPPLPLLKILLNFFILFSYCYIDSLNILLAYSKTLPGRVKREIIEPEAKDMVCIIISFSN